MKHWQQYEARGHFPHPRFRAARYRFARMRGLNVDGTFDHSRHFQGG